MFDIGWTELLLIGIVALIVVGPKDLPMLFRKAGQFMGRARGMAREFSRAMEQAADETGMKDAAKTMRDLSNPKKMGMDALNEATEGFRKWQPDSATGKLAEERAAASAAARAKAASVKKPDDAGNDPGAVEQALAVPEVRVAPVPQAPAQPEPVQPAPPAATAPEKAKT